jgi:hypothetical protein
MKCYIFAIDGPHCIVFMYYKMKVCLFRTFEWIQKYFKIQKTLMYVLSDFSKPEVAWKSIRAQNRMKTLV